MQHVVDLLERKAPRFLGLLRFLMANERAGENERGSFDNSYRCFAIFNIIMYTFRPRRCTKWATMWGVQLHSAGTKTTLISILYRLGINVGYHQVLKAFSKIGMRQKTLIRDLARSGRITVSYDNLEQMRTVRNQESEHQDNIFSGTTGLV